MVDDEEVVHDVTTTSNTETHAEFVRATFTNFYPSVG